jgi:hypothetical protein
MKDEELISLCKSIYRRHREAIDLIVEYGKVSILGELVQEVLKEDGDYEILNSKAQGVSFLPFSWKNILPENARAYKHLSRRVSVICWIGLRTKTNQVKLIFELCRMDDPRIQMACVKGLDGAEFKLGKKAFNESAKYSRFYSETQKVSDPDDAEEVRAAVEKLLENAKKEFPKAEAVFKQVFKRT